MAEIDIWQASFNGAELTPLLEGREDIARYPTGCRKLRNAHGLIQGPARRRFGGRYVTPSKSNGNAWFVPFIRSRQLAYLLEFGDNYIRFYRNRAQLLAPSSPFAPYEVATPWTYADMTNTDGTFKFGLVQSIDVLYICSGTGVVKQLNRFGDTNWTLTDYDFIGGPFASENLTATTVYASAQTGTVTLTASTAIFTSNRIGSLVRLQAQNLSSVKPWEANTIVSTNGLRRSEGKTYKQVTAGVTENTNAQVHSGTVRLTHEEGTASDGGGGGKIQDTNQTTAVRVSTGYDWEFQDPGYGIAKITAVGSAGTTATAVVQQWRVGSNAQLPAAVVSSGNATTRWAWGLFSIADGFPTDVTFFRERLVFASPRKAAFSVPAAFTEFAQETAGQVLADNAFTIELSSDRDETIQWLKPAHDALIVGTTGGEHVISEMTTNQVFGPLNRKSEPHTGHGSNGSAPVRIGSRLLFVEANGLRIRATKFDQGLTAPSQNDLAEHITSSGIIQQAFQEKPDNLNWTLSSDGLLPCLTFSEEQDVFGWSDHFIGGFRDASRLRSAKIRTIAVIPSPDGTSDDLWYLAERYINGGVKRYVEFIAVPSTKPKKWEYETEEAFTHRILDWQADLVYMDSAATLDNPLTISSISLGTTTTITSTSHGLSNGDSVRLDEIIGPWQLNAHKFTIGNVTTHTFRIKDEDLNEVVSTGYPVYVSGGVARKLVISISGLSPWEGETLQVLADGAVHPDIVVSGGAATLSFPAARVHTGYNANMVIETQRPIGGNEKGSAQGKIGRVNKIVIRVDTTLGGKYGPTEDHLDALEYRTALDEMDQAIPLFSGDIQADFPDGNSDLRTVTIMQDQPLPFTLVGLGTEQEVND